MQYVIITFRQVIFSDASTSGFKSVHYCLIALVSSLMLFLKVLMRKVLTRCKTVFCYRFWQNENGKLLRCDLFCFAPSLIYLSFKTSFVKRFSKTLCIKSSLFCDFSNWTHVRTIATCKKKTFSSRKFLKSKFCYF